MLEAVATVKDDYIAENNIKSTGWLFTEEKDGIVEIKHKSEWEQQVHEFYAGEAAKVWPGQDEIDVEFSLKDITLHNWKDGTNGIIGDLKKVYFKVLLNDEWRLLDNDGNYYSVDRDSDPEDKKFDINLNFKFKHNADVPVFLTVIACGKAAGADYNLGKYHIVIQGDDIKGDGGPLNSIKKSFTGGSIDGTSRYISGNISFTRRMLIAGLMLAENASDEINFVTRQLARTEINNHIGTRIYYDIDNDIIGTYTGKYRRPFNDDELNNSNLNTIILNGIIPSYLDSKLDDIIDGSYAEDSFYPLYSPDNIWNINTGGRIPPHGNDSYESIDQALDFFDNHFWDADRYTQGLFNAGGLSATDTDSSAYHKAQLYWDYYVIPLYMGIDIGSRETTNR